MSDGGPGFLDVLHAATGGQLHAVTVCDPYGHEVPAAVLEHDGTAYVECAMAVGLTLTPEAERRPEVGSSRGVGMLVAAAVDLGVRPCRGGSRRLGHQRRGSGVARGTRCDGGRR